MPRFDSFSGIRRDGMKLALVVLGTARCRGFFDEGPVSPNSYGHNLVLKPHRVHLLIDLGPLEGRAKEYIHVGTLQQDSGKGEFVQWSSQELYTRKPNNWRVGRTKDVCGQ